MKRILIAICCMAVGPVFAQSLDSCDFETSCDFINIHEDTNNIWQIGPPQKEVFNAAHSPENAMITDTINTYPAGNHSWFEVAYSDGGYTLYAIKLSFWHRIDTDSGRDGGYIEISTDHRTTWTNIAWDTLNTAYDPPVPLSFPDTGSYNFYTKNDTLYNGQPGFSGTLQDWTLSQYWWIWEHPAKPAPGDTVLSGRTDTVFFRFHFISDSIDNHKDGWMIDDLSVNEIPLGDGVLNIQRATLPISIFPNPSDEYFTLHVDNPPNLKYTVSITDMFGKRVRQIDNVLKNEIKIDRNDLPDGLYLITIRNEKGQQGYAKAVLD